MQLQYCTAFIAFFKWQNENTIESKIDCIVHNPVHGLVLSPEFRFCTYPVLPGLQIPKGNTTRLIFGEKVKQRVGTLNLEKYLVQTYWYVVQQISIVEDTKSLV